MHVFNFFYSFVCFIYLFWKIYLRLMLTFNLHELMLDFRYAWEWHIYIFFNSIILSFIFNDMIFPLIFIFYFSCMNLVAMHWRIYGKGYYDFGELWFMCSFEVYKWLVLRLQLVLPLPYHIKASFGLFLWLFFLCTHGPHMGWN